MSSETSPEAPKVSISLVIPVYNEEESLEPLLREIQEVASSYPGEWEYLFIDDGSRDGSWAAIRRLAASEPLARGIRLRANFGKAAALAAGFQAAKNSIVMTMDADLQDDPHEIPKFIEKLNGGLDLVSGWKKIRHDPWHKVLPSRIFNGMVSFLTRVPLHDHNCGMKAYRSQVVKEIRLYGELHRFTPSLAAMNGFTVGEMILNHRPRKFGRSKYGAKRFVKGFLDLLTVAFRKRFGERPMHALGFAALVFVFAGIPLCVFGLRDWAFLLWLFASQSFLAGLLAELQLVKGNPSEKSQAIAERIGYE